MWREFAQRLETVYRAAALAIERLGHINIVKYEPTSVEEAGADLSLWETMAPVLRDTVVDVNALVSAVKQAFAPPEQRAAGNAWAPPPASSDERLAQEVEAVLNACAARLARRVADLGQRVRQPEVVSDRWALMAELQAFRADFRAQIGDLVYLTATAFEQVPREQVGPGYEVQVAAAAALRGAVADLRRSLGARVEKLVDVQPRDVPALARRFEEMLAAFGTLPAAITLKTPDKRLLVERREQLAALASRPEPTLAQLRELLETLTQEFTRIVTELTQRTLGAHDRAVRATCGARLEQAVMHLFLGSPGAERVVREALRAAEALYGRDPGFDAFLRKARSASGQSLDDGQLRETLEIFRERLAALPVT